MITTAGLDTPVVGRRSGFAVFIHRHRLMVAILLAMSLAGATALNQDLAKDSAPQLGSLFERIEVVTLPVLMCLLAVSALHYVATAFAARAASGVRLPFGELVATQLAASAANRLTPSGIGGATVTGRYFIRRGRLDPSAAAAAVSALALLGAVADVLAFGAVVAVGSVAGLAGARSEAPLLLQKIVGLFPLPTGWWRWAVMTLAVLVATLGWLVGKRTGAIVERVRGALRTYRGSLAALLSHPARLAALMTASAGTTLLLATGFAAAATLGTGGLPRSAFCALMIGYMLAAAAGNALPTPGGIGTADAALTGVLLAAHMPAADALATVLAFRLISFWSPAVIGLCLLAPLRRRGAL